MAGLGGPNLATWQAYGRNGCNQDCDLATSALEQMISELTGLVHQFQARCHMVQKTIGKDSSWSPPAREKSSSFVPRRLAIQTQPNPHEPLAKKATGIEGSHQSIEQAVRFGHRFANVVILPPPAQTSAPMQAKSMTGDLSSSPTEQRSNQTGLPDHLKAGIENLSGFSLDNVKVHYNSDKPTQLNALAYTQGTDIHVAPGQERHLAHEAWHVVQQAEGRVRPTMQLRVGVLVNDDRDLSMKRMQWAQKPYEGSSQSTLPLV
jgi:hypothetical protein